MGEELSPQEHGFPLPRQEKREGMLVGLLNPGAWEGLKTVLWDLFKVMEIF